MIHECKRINYEIFIYIIYLDVDYFQRGLVFVVDIFVKFRYHNPPPPLKKIKTNNKTKQNEKKVVQNYLTS